MIFELMEAHFGWLGPIIEESRVGVPGLTAGNTFQGLRLFKGFLISCSSPEAGVVVVTAWFVRFVRLKLRLTEVLGDD